MTRSLYWPLTLSLGTLLTPALFAAGGCFFGSDEVPLGNDRDAAVAGSGGIPAAGSGGVPAGGSGGAASSGGAGGTGDAGAFDGPCLEVLTPLVGSDPSPVGVSGADVQQLLAGTHHTQLSYLSGGSTEVTLRLAGIEVFYVESTPNPNFGLDIVVNCTNHVRARTYGRVTSADGKLDEMLPELVFAATADSAVGGLTLDVAELGGSYQPSLSPNQCFWMLQFDFFIQQDSFSGGLTETIVSSPCDAIEPTSAATGRESGVFQCQGSACRSAADDSIVLAGTSCDRFGVQSTHASDTASFTRQGDVIQREEFWGCGCATEPEFVLLYDPVRQSSATAPLELRLCHHDGADGCEAACSGPVSYDLGPIFARAGVSDFVFVD
jgi:hypothetical protein